MDYLASSSPPPELGSVSVLYASVWNTTLMDMYVNSGVVINATATSQNGTVHDVLDLGSRVTFIFMYTLASVAAVIGNTLAIVVFVKGNLSRTDLRPFLINLAVADLIMAFICIPFTFTYQIIGEWIFSDPMCPIVSFLQQVAVTASVSTNMAVGVDRFFAITRPLKKRLTLSRSKYVIVLIWTIAIVINVVQIIVGRTYRKSDGSQQCGEKWPEPAFIWTRSYTLFLMFLTYVLPLTILTVTYAIVGRLLWRRNLPGHSDEMRDAHQMKSTRKIVKMLVTIVLLFGLCWLPLHTFFLFESFMPWFMEPHEKHVLYYVCHWLAMANSFVNPVIYCCMNDSFLADVKTLFQSSPCWKKQKQRSYRSGARRWKLGNNVGDITSTLSDPQAGHGLLTLKDSTDLWHNGNVYDTNHTTVYFTNNC